MAQEVPTPLPESKEAPQFVHHDIKPFKGTAELTWDLVHTRLELSPDIEKKQIAGVAHLTLKPRALARERLSLDAKGLFVDSVLVSLTGKDSLLTPYLNYNDSLHLILNFQERIRPEQSIKVSVYYSARPASLYNRGLIGKPEENGMRFVNSRDEKGLPNQLWTQGETDYNSCWLPTLDQPNAKTSWEALITVAPQYEVLSNGRLVYMLLNGDGTKTFYWKQEKKHAPYLCMLAIGEFEVGGMEWRDSIPVTYYLEPEYSVYGDLIFSRSVEMLEFFSNRFGYDYPWDKLSHVCVHEFIAGGMENTGAVVYRDGVQHDSISHNDYSYESLIVHEVAHQWFGNLVTCRNWSNLVLNEGFATYAEYLWLERDSLNPAAFERLLSFRQTYFQQANYVLRPLVDHSYGNPDELFDAHSYQKGALVLHLLRKKIGDRAFFKALELFLKEHEFGLADWHDLQKQMEYGSGMDLASFFNQWFMSPGHPVLDVTYDYVDSLNVLNVRISQIQSEIMSRFFEIETGLLVSEEGKLREYPVVMKSNRVELSIPMFKEPDFVQLDPLCAYPMEMKHNKPWFWIVNQLHAKDPALHALGRRAFLDRFNSLNPAERKVGVQACLSYGRNLPMADNQLITVLMGSMEEQYDLSPLLKSESTWVRSRTLRYLSQTAQIDQGYLIDQLREPSYFIQEAAIYAMRDNYNSQFEEALLNYAKKNIDQTARALITVLSFEGSHKAINAVESIVLREPIYLMQSATIMSRLEVANLDRLFDFSEQFLEKYPGKESEIEAYLTFVLEKAEANRIPSESMIFRNRITEFLDKQ